MEKLVQRRVVILGGGESGVGSALLAKRCGIEPFVSDVGILKPPFKEKLSQNNIAFEEGGHSDKAISWSSLVVKSPGIPDDAPIVHSLQKKGVEVISEIEFAYRQLDFLQREARGNGDSLPYRPILVGITGSNGKTTSAHWLYHLLANAGYDVALCGNVGRSFAGVLAEEKLHEYYVIELSSFQLDGIATFRADIGILLNITPDHLDRYGGELARYARSKMRLTMNMDSESTFIFWADDPQIGRLIPDEAPYMVAPFATSEAGSEYASAFLENDAIHFLPFDEERHFSVGISQGIALQGVHNMCNAMAVSLAAIELGLTEEELRQGLKSFHSLPHRMEVAGEVDGVVYINDSKATNIDAAQYALAAQERPVVLILGGTDKGNDYDTLKALVQKQCKALVFLGVDNRKLKQAFGSLGLPFGEASSTQEALELAQGYASSGDVVLLSPCCASFDLFANYKDRGDQFKRGVKALGENYARG